MDDTAKNEILVAIAKLGTKIDSMQEQVAKIPEIEKQVAKIPDMQKEIVKTQEQVTSLEEQVTGLQEQVAKIPEIEKQLAEIKEDTRNISRSVAVIEQEHGDKLKALFDAFTINTEKIERQKERIHFCEKKLENHDTEIDYLTTKVQGL